MKKTLRFVLYFFLALFSFILLYLTAAFTLSRVAVEEVTCNEQTIDCYILSNGVHTDLVLPLTHPLKNWLTTVSINDTKSKNTNYEYVAFGWGDKGFYLATPTWADLTLKTSLSAGFGLSTTAMHTTFYNHMNTSDKCVKIKLCKNQYLKLITYIENSFELKNSKAICIDTDVRYSKADAFYEANGAYTLFKTCNTWANNGLKACGKKAAFWTPFDSGIFYHYQ